MTTLQQIRQQNAASHFAEGARWYWFAPSRGTKMAVLMYPKEIVETHAAYLYTGPFDSKAEAEAAGEREGGVIKMSSDEGKGSESH